MALSLTLWFWLGLLWLLWLIGMVSQQPNLLILGTILADCFAVWMLYQIAFRTPKAWRQTMLGFVLGMLVIGLSDLAVLLGFASTLEPPLSVFGAVLFLLTSLALPILLERQGVYKKGFAWQIILIAAAIAVLLSVLLTILFQPPILRVVYQTTGLFLTSLFIMQSQDFAGGSIGRVLRMLSIAFAVSSFSQVAFAIIPGLFPDSLYLADLTRQTFWTAGVSLLAFVPRQK